MRIGCRLCWLCMKGVPRVIDLGKGATTLLGFRRRFHLTRLRDVAQEESRYMGIWICLTSSLGSPVIIVEVRSHSPDSGSFQFSQSPAKVKGVRLSWRSRLQLRTKRQ